MKRFMKSILNPSSNRLRGAMCLLLLAASGAAHGAPAPTSVTGKLTSEQQLSSKFRLNDQDPESSIPTPEERNKNPLEFGYFIQDLLVQSEAALKAKDYPALVRYRRALVKAAPERATGWSKLCEAYDLINDREHAIRTCRQAIQRDGAAVGDFERLVKLTLQKPEPLVAAEITELKDVLAHLEIQDATSDTKVADFRCQLAVRTNDAPLLESCSSVLAAKAPNDVKTIIYQWSLAVRQGNKQAARVLFERAKTMGVPEANLERMAKFSPVGLAGATRWITLAVVAAGLIVLAAVRWGQRKRLPAQPA